MGKLNVENPAIKPDWYAVCMDETAYWNIREEDKPFIEKMIGVYLFNRNSQTYCCELTPSYYLAHVYNDIWFVGDVSDEKREELCERYIDASYEDSSTYMHVRSVERMLADSPDRFSHYGEPQNTDPDEGDGESEVREHFQGNQPF